MSLETQAAGIHDSAALESQLEQAGDSTFSVASQLQQRATGLHKDASITGFGVHAANLGNAAQVLGAASPIMRQLALAGQAGAHLSTTASLLDVVSGYAKDSLNMLSQGKSLSQALLRPKALEGLLGAALPGVTPKVLHMALSTAAQVAKFAKHPQLSAALPLLKVLRSALGANLGTKTTLTDSLLAGLTSAVSGKGFDLKRFLAGSLTALSKDVNHRARVLKASDTATVTQGDA